MSQATTLSLRLPNNAVSDEQLLQEMTDMLPVGVQNLVLTHAGDPTLLKTDGAFRVMWQACLEQAPLTRLVRVIDAIYSKDTFSQDTFQMRVTTLFLTAMSFSSVPILKPELDQLCSQSPERTTPLALVAPIMEKAQPTADEDLITVFYTIAEKLKEQPKIAAFLTEIASLSTSEKASKISSFMQQIPELLAKITELDLDYKKLSTLPSEIALLVNLEKLYLRNNQLTQLPEALFKLVNLQELYLAANQLTQLPEALSKLVNLQELGLSGNELTRLPEALSKLVNLEKLYLHGNQLTQLPEAIFKLVNLRELYLGRNQLTQQAKDALAPLKERGCKVHT